MKVNTILAKMPDAEQDSPNRSLSLCDYKWDDNQVDKILRLEMLATRMVWIKT